MIDPIQAVFYLVMSILTGGVFFVALRKGQSDTNKDLYGKIEKCVQRGDCDKQEKRYEISLQDHKKDMKEIQSFLCGKIGGVETRLETKIDSIAAGIQSVEKGKLGRHAKYEQMADRTENIEKSQTVLSTKIDLLLRGAGIGT